MSLNHSGTLPSTPEAPIPTDAEKEMASWFLLTGYRDNYKEYLREVAILDLPVLPPLTPQADEVDAPNFVNPA